MCGTLHCDARLTTGSKQRVGKICFPSRGTVTCITAFCGARGLQANAEGLRLRWETGSGARQILRIGEAQIRSLVGFQSDASWVRPSGGLPYFVPRQRPGTKRKRGGWGVRRTGPSGSESLRSQPLPLSFGLLKWGTSGAISRQPATLIVSGEVRRRVCAKCRPDGSEEADLQGGVLSPLQPPQGAARCWADLGQAMHLVQSI
jgi:hypothetical protein